MVITGYCCLTIYGETLDFEDIKRNLDFEPTDVYHRGESHDRGTYPEDSWGYEVALDSKRDVDEIIYEFISFVLNYKDYICYLRTKNNVRLWCDIYADNAQSKIFFSPKTIDIISKLGIGIDIEMYLHESGTEEE